MLAIVDRSVSTKKKQKKKQTKTHVWQGSMTSGTHAYTHPYYTYTCTCTNAHACIYTAITDRTLIHKYIVKAIIDRSAAHEHVRSLTATFFGTQFNQHPRVRSHHASPTLSVQSPLSPHACSYLAYGFLEGKMLEKTHQPFSWNASKPRPARVAHQV